MTVPPVIFLEDEIKRLKEKIPGFAETVQRTRKAVTRADNAHNTAVNNLSSLEGQIQRAEQAIKVLKGQA